MACVWLQLYYEGDEKPIGRAFKIRPLPEDVNDLAEEVHAKFDLALTHCSAGQLFVYAPGTAVPLAEGTEALDPGDPVRTGTTSKTPLIVIAPPQDDDSRKRKPKKPKKQFTSPASRESESRNALHMLSNYLSNTELPVFVNGVEQSLQLDRLHETLLRNPDTAAEDAVCNSLSVTNELDSAETESLDFLRLQNESENIFQAGHFQEEFFQKEVFRALDRSAATVEGPFFMEQQRAKCRVSDEYYVTCIKTGKPDGTSLVAPMDIEIKSDVIDHLTLAVVCIDVLIQACKRAVVRHQLYAYLRYSVAFAVSNRTAWCVVAHRTVDADGVGEDVSVNLWRIPHSSVARIWMAMTRRVESNPQHCLSNDGPSIIAVLKAADINPWACRVKRINKSGSPVYAVTQMGKFQWGRKINEDGIAMNKIGDFAMKLVENQQLFENEDVALSAIGEVAQKRSTQFYGLGSKEFKKKKDDSKEESEEDMLTVYNKEDWNVLVKGKRTRNGDSTGWWEFKELSDASGPHYGAIVMMVGQPIENAACLDELARGVSASLELAHEAGYLHCDIRKSNLLRFNIGCRLVDFGLSCKTTGAGFYNLGAGAQKDSVGHRIAECVDQGVQFEWTVADDYQMLLHMIAKLAEKA